MSVRSDMTLVLALLADVERQGLVRNLGKVACQRRKKLAIGEHHQQRPNYTVTSGRIPQAQRAQRLTRKNSPNAELYGLHGLPLTYFWFCQNAVLQTQATSHTRSLVNQNRRTSSMRPSSSSDFPILPGISLGATFTLPQHT